MKSLSQTFIPKSLIKKTDLKNTNPLLDKNSFEKTHGNIYVELDPPEIKFNGYELNTVCSATFKIINKAPIPQRFNILPPTQSQFSIKVNKKGSIPTGMYETVQVNFKANEFKYIYDIIKINTETDNFVLPVYAYPSIPNIDSVFPKMIDFGNIQLKQTESNLYPIRNTTPIDYAFEFYYTKECSEIMITPLKGTIPSNGQLNVEIAFIPSKKMTYSAEVYFQIQQFDFQPKLIKIIGNGKDKQMGKTFKRLKSSKLAPLNNDTMNASMRKEDKQRMNQTDTFKHNASSRVLKDGNQKSNLMIKNIRKTSSRPSYPKLLNNTLKPKASNLQMTLEVQNKDKKSLSVQARNSDERQFINRFNKVQQMDKMKEIKFHQYIGDRAMTEQQISDQKEVVSEMKKFRQNLLRTKNQNRYNPEKLDYAEIEYKKVQQQKVSWDQNRNDDLYERKTILNKFVKAASKIIEVRRMKQRLAKIRQFLSDCSTRQEVAQKVEISYLKSLESHSSTAFNGQIQLEFNLSSIQPQYYELQYNQGKDKFNNRLFQTQGKADFDDLTAVDLIEPHETQMLSYKNFTFPTDFVNLSKIIPPKRISGEQQFSVKSSSLPTVEALPIPTVADKQLSIPAHYFIHQKEGFVRMKLYNAVDQKDPQFIMANNQALQDEYQGWSKGQFQVLKAKLMKNTGISYQTQSSYNYSSNSRNDIGFLGDITKNLPAFINRHEIADQLEDNDSDEQNYDQLSKTQAQQLMQKIEQANPKTKQRLSKPQIVNQERALKDLVQKNLQKDKRNKLSKYVSKTRQFNKYIQNDKKKIPL